LGYDPVLSVFADDQIPVTRKRSIAGSATLDSRGAKPATIARVADDRDWSWLARPQPAAPLLIERTVWRVTKDTRHAEARVRAVPHGHELRILVGAELMWSCVYRSGESAELFTASTGVLQDFQRLGWSVVE
jgi:hypothetical protein